MLRFDVCMGKARGNNREVEMKIPDTVPYRAANEVVLKPTFGIAVAKDSRGAEHINSALPETRFDLTPEKPTSAYKQATSPHSTALTESRLCALGGAPVTSWQRSNVGMNARLYSATRRVRPLPPEKGKKLPPINESGGYRAKLTHGKPKPRSPHRRIPVELQPHRTAPSEATPTSCNGCR